MALYDDIKQMIEGKMYTIVQCQTMLNNYYKYLQITNEQYDELMEMSQNLEANNSNDEYNAKFTVINKNIESIIDRIEKIEETIKSGGQEIPEVDNPDGSELDPILAYSGLAYKKNLYYLDPTNNEVYKCRDRADITENGVVLFNLPHELVNIYFDWVRKN